MKTVHVKDLKKVVYLTENLIPPYRSEAYGMEINNFRLSTTSFKSKEDLYTETEGIYIRLVVKEAKDNVATCENIYPYRKKEFHIIPKNICTHYLLSSALKSGSIGF